MFAIEGLWLHTELKPLQKVYEGNPQDRRLVVVAKGDGVSLEETIALHQWCDKQGYRTIPSTWETEDLETLDVVHLSKFALTILRRDPFSLEPAPLTPNSWLNRLPPERFDALLLAQETGDVPLSPTRMHIKDTLKPALEAAELSASWQEIAADVAFAQSGQAPRNDRQKKVIKYWQRAAPRRFFDPTASGLQVVNIPQSQSEKPLERAAITYTWYAPGEPSGWNWRLTELSSWIVTRYDYDDLDLICSDVFGGTSSIKFTGKMKTTAFYIVEEALRRGYLDKLANAVHFEMPAQPPAPPPSQIFNQAGQQVIGAQINTVIGDGARNVAVGSGVTQIISTITSSVM